jgi:hypothetical protein
MQDVDRPDDVQRLAEPARSRRQGVQREPLRLMLCPESLHGVPTNLWGRRDVGQQPTVRTAEAQLTIGQSIDLVALFVNSAVVPATEHGEIRQRSGASVGPVTDVVALTEPRSTAREATAAVAMQQRSP